MMNNHSPTLVHRRYTEPSRGTRLHFANLRDVVRYETFWKIGEQEELQKCFGRKRAIDANCVRGPKSPRQLAKQVPQVRQ